LLGATVPGATISRVKLFLSHASEDKNYVRQLADRLVAEGFEVWLDERNMTLGDSLLGKINEGLLESDYGVVVLSPTFFGKKWTRVELGALMALETKTKKMILPIWKDLSAVEITDLMPTMADYLSVSASAGLDVVVQAIKSGVGGSEHRRTMSRFEHTKARLVKMNAATKSRQNADVLLNSVDGVRRVRAEANRFFEQLAAQFEALSTEDLKFTVKETHADTFSVQGPRLYGVEVHFRDGASNVAAFAELICTFFQIGRMKPLHGGREETRRLTTLQFFPYFDAAGTAVWSPTEKREETTSTEDLIALLAEKLTDYLTKEQG
jgi:hypothetical protein